MISLASLCILYQAVLVMSMVSSFLYICVRDQDSRQDKTDLRHVSAVLLASVRQWLRVTGYLIIYTSSPGQDPMIPKYISVVYVI